MGCFWAFVFARRQPPNGDTEKNVEASKNTTTQRTTVVVSGNRKAGTTSWGVRVPNLKKMCTTKPSPFLCDTVDTRGTAQKKAVHPTAPVSYEAYTTTKRQIARRARVYVGGTESCRGRRKRPCTPPKHHTGACIYTQERTVRSCSWHHGPRGTIPAAAKLWRRNQHVPSSSQSSGPLLLPEGELCCIPYAEAGTEAIAKKKRMTQDEGEFSQCWGQPRELVV